MSDWDRKTSRNVETIQLGAFIMRKEVYKQIGGFDDNLFYYFGENDVSKRVRDKGWLLYFDSKSEAIHLESKWVPKNTESIRTVWSINRFYYFKKHYGLLKALVVEFFARMSKKLLPILAILLLGTFLRFYRFFPNFIFNGEMGTDYLNVWGMLHGTRTWLIGPRTSHEWFFIPPLAYWIYIPFLI